MSMKRILCTVMALCSLFMTAAADDTQQILWAEQMAQELDNAARAFGIWYTVNGGDDSILNLPSGWRGDRSQAAVIYRYMPGTDIALHTADIKEYLYVMDGGYSYSTYALITGASASKAFTGSCDNEIWILSYWDCADVMVCFIDQGNGTVLVSASYMPVKCGPQEMMSIFEQMGVPATYEKIR